MKKYKYRLVLNGTDNIRNRPFLYQYRNTKDIAFQVKENAALIEFETDTQYKNLFDRGNYLFDLFCDAVKRCALTHILQYSKNLIIKSG